MKRNPVKAALAEGRPQVGTWLSFGDLTATRLMARVGFPWLTVDMEHSPIDWSQAGALFGVIADAGCVPLARVPQGSHDYIKRVLDAGAHGIVVPMVNTVEQARAAIAAAKYPPEGNRSLGGTLHAMNFDAAAGDYYQQANNEILVVLQTESPEGCRERGSNLQSAGGRRDLCGTERFDRPDARGRREPIPPLRNWKRCSAVSLAAGKKVGTPVGLHQQTIAQVEQRIAEGWQFIALGSELRMMVSKAQEFVSALNLKPRNRAISPAIESCLLSVAEFHQFSRHHPLTAGFTHRYLP